MNEVLLTSHSDSRWAARIDLGFKSGTRTTLFRRQHSGPLRVQKPFYPEDEVCHLYLLHPPGGMAGQDDIEVTVGVEENAHALITTPAANKVYRSAGSWTNIRQSLQCQGVLEWLPQSTILFGGSKVRQRSDYYLGGASRLITWDIVGLGRPASTDAYDQGVFEQTQTIYLDSRPIFRDRQGWGPDSTIRTAAWGYGGTQAMGLMLGYPADTDLLDRTRLEIAQSNGQITATLVDQLLVIRAWYQDVTLLQDALINLWSKLRPLLLGKTPCHPRIWAT